MSGVPGLSKTKVDDAGRRLRKWVQRSQAPDYDPSEDFAILSRWRAQFEAPMQATAVGLRATVSRCFPRQPVRVNRRFKREVQIIHKLVARPSMRLSQMEDVAGCRAVLDSLEQVRTVQAALTGARKMEIAGVDDYVANPQPTGYRAVHVHGVRDGIRVEIQLRTGREHAWAELVEDWDQTFGFDLKHGRGPEPVPRYFQLLGAMYGMLDKGQQIPLDVQLGMAELREDLRRDMPVFVKFGGGVTGGE